jgi:hypothetical protein
VLAQILFSKGINHHCSFINTCQIKAESIKHKAERRTKRLALSFLPTALRS